MAAYTPLDDSQSWSSHDVLFGGSTEQERMIEQGAGITVLVFVSLTLLFSIINTHKSGAHLMLGFIITGFALCLWHLLKAYRNGDLGKSIDVDAMLLTDFSSMMILTYILAQTALLTLLCIIANIYFWQ
ncbi:hypothetical protein KVV02_003076 [Mortierella alpina]|uniref:Uncharacterized protein n=1 Tax=Mortierella alpina TaxID=64518 RepID=A0A9P8A393_MORAP|nr:hypothetical protein KVV02_003076 [Mortierella alpina]